MQTLKGKPNVSFQNTVPMDKDKVIKVKNLVGIY